MFWDRRLERAEGGTFTLHDVSYEATGVVRLQLPSSLDSLVAAQSILPLLIRDEMRGHAGEVDIHGEPNELATVIDNDFHGVWRLILERLMANEEYRALFLAAYPDTPLEEHSFESMANALGAFMIDGFTLPDSPWDRFLAGEDAALGPAERRGAALFYGEANCASCHSGPLLTDQEVHNIGIRPMSRGPTLAGFVDRGAAHRSNEGPDAAYKFRTPPLRNVADTGPWMHNGSITTLQAAVRHHLDPRSALRDYDASLLAPEVQSQVHHAPDIIEAVEANLDPEIADTLPLSDEEIADLLAFLEALSSPDLDTLEALIPEQVPSGLALVDP
jgi:cytochrome c peroxidase